MGKKNSEESNNKRSINLIEKFKNDDKYIESHSNGQKGKKMPEDFAIEQSNRYKNIKYSDRYGSEKSEIIRKKQSLSAKGKEQTEDHKKNAARARAKYLWCIECNGICYINLLRSEFIYLIGHCPFKNKQAIKIEK
jgi:hypothetical protein